MKKAILLILAVLFLFGMALEVGAANILDNPGFEDGVLSPWTGLDWSVINTENHTGVWSATVDGNHQLKQDITPTFTGLITEVSFWMKQTEAQIAAYTFFYDNGTSDEHLINLNTGDWEFFDVTIELTAGLNLSAFDVYGYGSGDGTPDVTFFDDATIEVVPIPAAVWLLGSGLIGMFGLRRKFKK